MESKVSLVIVEYFSIEDIIGCASSFFCCDDFFECEIIISSNSQYDRAIQQQLEVKYPIFKWLFNQCNGGFAYAMNRGLEVATGDILVILNPDVRVRYGLNKMINYFDNHSTIGIVAPQIINSSGIIQDSCRCFITPYRFLKRHCQRFLLKNRFYTVPIKPKSVDWVIGAFMMMSRVSYRKVGGLDEGYFLYCEDMDLCARMYQNGYEVVYYPEAIIEYEGTRSARKSFKYARVFLVSLFRFWRKFGFNYNG